MSQPRLRGLYGAQIPGQLTLKPEWWAAGLAISVLGALAAATASLLKAIRLPVLAAAQHYAWQQAQHRWLIFQSAVALVVFAAAGGLLWYGDSLLSGFAVLAGLLLGAALGLPAILELVLSLGQRRAHHALAAWFWADSRQQLSGLSLALMALLLALRGQCRRRHHGRNLQPNVYRLARRTAGGRRLHQCR